MSTLTIPKNITKGAELIVLARKEYERLLSARIIPEYQATAHEKKRLHGLAKTEPQASFLPLMSSGKNWVLHIHGGRMVNAKMQKKENRRL